LAKTGAVVAVNYQIRDAEAEATCQEIRSRGGQAIAVQVDVSIAAQVAEMVPQVESQLGPIAILVNNAGISCLQPFDQITEQDWDEVLAVNLKSVFLVTQAVLPGMRAAKWGRIIGKFGLSARLQGLLDKLEVVGSSPIAPTPTSPLTALVSGLFSLTR
jgi:3-oxoacyl-[acyl-carrier protein] reductase